MNNNKLFHPAVQAWFKQTFQAPTRAQNDAWPAIKQGRHVLIAAPTGSGKTLAAFLSAIDDLVREDMENGLKDEVYILYVSPLKALSNDIHKNLDEPLQGINGHGIRSAVRTGDTTQSERNRMRREPPHILVTTPESLFILLTSDSGRQMLSTVKSVIVDEIHALAANKRGSHLSLSLERLETLCANRPVRIGLSATQTPIETVARFLIGNRPDDCVIIDSGHVRDWDLAVEMPGSPLEAVMANEIWQEVYDRLAELINEHTTTLIFANTRRLTERAARFLAERLGEENVTAHHGSLAREHRLDAEQRLKHGQLRALVATASLELGIDIGDVDLVCQLGSPRSISAFLQRVGRSGHAIGKTPKGRLFPQTRDDLLECVALLDAINRNELDRLHIPEGHLDVLSQQIIAEAGSREWPEDDLYRQFTRAWPYRDLDRKGFRNIIQMLSEGFTTRRGRRSRYLHYDAVNRIIKPRKNARLTAVTNGGTIPDQFDYSVVLEPHGHMIGTLNEDFAFESLPGDIFQLGNTSYRILKIELGKVRVEDAKGQPPNIPFWFGEAPGRSDELSLAVSRLRGDIDRKLSDGMDAAIQWLITELNQDAAVAGQLVEYLAATRAALGSIPTQTNVIFERFFDEAGDQHLVIHSPYGSRLNRAWGLGLRKRFCRQFNFELQAAALEDTIVISLGPTHSFPLEDATGFVNSNNIRHNVTQAMLAVPMFPTHWRWNASIALAIKRNNNGRRVPAQFQRTDAEDLMAVVFPDQLACQDNLTGEREIPDHPLVTQTVHDCLNDLMDINGMEQLLKKFEAGDIRIQCRDLNGPSPMAQEILTARPYAFLDDAPAEERRTQAVNARRFMDPAEASELARLNPDAIRQVCAEAWPEINNAEELHDALMILGIMLESEGLGKNPHTADYYEHLAQLMEEGRAAVITTGNGLKFWVCAERLPLVNAVFVTAAMTPVIKAAGSATERDWDRDSALLELVRARLEGLGPVTEPVITGWFESKTNKIRTALLWLENEGYAMQGSFTQLSGTTEWCERGLLARMHRYTIRDLRAEIQAVTIADYMRFLFHWHGMVDRPQGENALLPVIERLEGFSVPAIAWEREILSARISDYLSIDMDRLCNSGRILWTRINREKLSNTAGTSKAGMLRNTPVVLINRDNLEYWRNLYSRNNDLTDLTSVARSVYDSLQENGAMFFVDIVRHSGLLRTQVEEALAELAAGGVVTSDSFTGLRALITPGSKRPSYGRQHRRRRTVTAAGNIDDAGRWSLLPIPESPAAGEPTGWIKTDHDTLNHIAWILLKRYGVVFRKLLEREGMLPPWRELLYVYRRMEARGEIRGGRFVDGVVGEQFALPDAVALLRKQGKDRQYLPRILISATDPLNLVGILLQGDRVPAVHTNRIVFENGVPVAKQLNGVVRFMEEVDPQRQWEITGLFTQRINPAGFVRPTTSRSEELRVRSEVSD